MGDLPSHFTHLRTHSHFSLLGATPSIDDLVARAVQDGRQSLALTDTNVLYGAVAFRRACYGAGIRPIIGMTVAVAIAPGEMYPDTLAGWGTLTLLAANARGYRSLSRLSSRLQTGSYRDRRREPQLSWDELREESEGLICLTGDRAGWLERFCRAGNRIAATRMLGRLGGIYGEQCYVAIRPGLLQSGNDLLGEELSGLGARFGIRSAAVQAIYCLDDEDRGLLSVMAAIRNNCLLDAVGPELLPALGDKSVDLAWPDDRILTEAYSRHPELLETTAEIATVCMANDVLPTAGTAWSGVSFADPALGESGLPARATAGMARFYGPNAAGAVRERLAHEVSTIEGVGHAELFLIVAEIVRFARSKGIAVSTRGSVANSLVAYCLGISTVDPIAHDLIFERFLNPARRNPPDIDLDFCSRRRDEVLHYVRETYGEDHMALVSTMSTLQLRSAVREVAKVFALSAKGTQALVDMLPRGWHPDPRRRGNQSLDEMLAHIEDDDQAQVLRIAYDLVDRPHHASIHPGGIVISARSLTDIVPVEMAAKGFYITQYTHEDIEAVGLPKIDLLGIRALTVLSDTTDLVRSARDPDFRLDEIPAGDQATGDLLAAAETIGVFQCESEGAQRTLRQLRARSVTDLAIAGAFFKPGPATGGMARAFVQRYRGEKPVAFLHPTLEPILGRTKGVLLFQEQVLRVVREIAGLSWEQADHIRRGMSKFKADEMEALAAEFLAGCCRTSPDGPGFTQEQASTLWEQVVAFAGYGFNQGHATAYADVSYRSAYLKAHWPAEFLCARLAGAGGFHHQAIYIAEARRLGIDVRPPHVNFSGRHFTLSYEADDENVQSRHPVLWMGLGQVRNLQTATIAAIVGQRHVQPFTSLDDLTNRVPMQARELQAVIRCGALAGLGQGRSAMLASSGHTQRAGSIGQMAFAFAEPPTPEMETARQQFEWEKHILGLPVSVSPLVLVDDLPPGATLRALVSSSGRPMAVNSYRLPGWTGGKGIFVSDGDSFVIARFPDEGDNASRPRATWEPMHLTGRWIVDEWDNGWFQVEKSEALA